MCGIGESLAMNVTRAVLTRRHGTCPRVPPPAGEGLVVAGLAFLENYETILSQKGISCAVYLV